jgi:hypothetical protein
MEMQKRKKGGRGVERIVAVERKDEEEEQKEKKEKVNEAGGSSKQKTDYSTRRQTRSKRRENKGS